jgi:hypothetical protein
MYCRIVSDETTEMNNERTSTYSLDGFADHVSRHRDCLLLSKSLDPTDCLRFSHGIPLRLEDMNMAGGYEVDTDLG